MNKKQIGVAAVDSGQLMIADPCYLKDWTNTDFDPDNAKDGEFSYNGACKATLSKQAAGQLNFKMGHAGAGVVFASGYGDGCYPVFATYNDEGRIIKVEIEMV